MMSEFYPKQARRLERKTVFADKQVTLVCPDTAYARTTTRQISETLKKFTGNVRLEIDPEPALLRQADGPLLLLGNLADSRCVQDLYFKFLCATDCRYPGPGGYELRTLCDPFGTGHNIIHIGYSDPAGLEEAAGFLLDRLADPLPGLLQIKAERLHVPPEEVRQISAAPLPDQAWQVHCSPLGPQKGYLYYLTGDRGLGLQYKEAWKAMISCGVKTTDKLGGPHLFMLPWIITWRLTEHSGLFSDEERFAITRFIYDWAQSDEGARHVERYFQNQRLPRQNHGLLPALSLAYAADYFSTHFPHLPGPSFWQKAVHKAFAPYTASWKPLCDGLCHGWWMSQPALLDYALLDPEHRYFEHGGAQKAAECAIAVVNNAGWMPSAGDSDMVRQFPGPSLRVAAAYYRDGRYKFAHDLAPESRKYKWLPALPPPRAFDCGQEPTMPADHIGVKVIPIDPLIYNIWKEDPTSAPAAVDTPPAAPIENCFDKLAFRSGWDPNDDYLLMDGLGGGSHSYADAGGILDYARFGQSWIVSEDSLVFTAPEDHSMLTIVRDGVMGTPPGFAILEANQTGKNGLVYLRLRLKKYADADWVREVFLLPGKCVVFHDTVIAQKEGDYAIEAHFRIPDKVALNGQLLVGKRKSASAGEVKFRLVSLSDPSMLRVAAVPVHLRYAEDNPVEGAAEEAAAWKERYQTPHIALSAFAARVARGLKAGESVSLTHMIQICGPQEPEITPKLFENKIVLEAENLSLNLTPHHLPTTPAAPRLAMDKTKILTPQMAFCAPATITAFNRLDQDEIIVLGCEDGSLLALDPEFNLVWQAQLDGQVHDIGAAGRADPLVVAGHGAAGLTAFNKQGQKRWQHVIRREPCPWPWWELSAPVPVRVVGGMFENRPLFAVGCGDIQVRLFDANGNECWKWRYNEGVPARIEIADIDRDGEPEILVGGEILTDVSCCRVLTHNRQLKAEFRVEGWTSRLTALAWGNINGRLLLACGANRGRNLHLYDVENLELCVEPELCNRRYCKAIDQDARRRRLWEKRLGGAVNGLSICHENSLVMAGTSQGFLLTFDLEGRCISSRLLEEGIAGLLPFEKGLLVRHISGRMQLVSPDGAGITPVNGPPASRLFQRAGTRLFFADNNRLFFIG